MSKFWWNFNFFSTKIIFLTFFFEFSKNHIFLFHEFTKNHKIKKYDFWKNQKNVKKLFFFEKKCEFHQILLIFNLFFHFFDFFFIFEVGSLAKGIVTNRCLDPLNPNYTMLDDKNPYYLERNIERGSVDPKTLMQGTQAPPRETMSKKETLFCCLSFVIFHFV